MGKAGFEHYLMWPHGFSVSAIPAEHEVASLSFAAEDIKVQEITLWLAQTTTKKHHRLHFQGQWDSCPVLSQFGSLFQDLHEGFCFHLAPLPLSGNQKLEVHPVIPWSKYIFWTLLGEPLNFYGNWRSTPSSFHHCGEQGVGVRISRVGRGHSREGRSPSETQAVPSYAIRVKTLGPLPLQPPYSQGQAPPKTPESGKSARDRAMRF